MRVVQVSFYRDPLRRPPGELLRAWPALLDVAAAVAATGVEVHVVQAASQTERVVRGAVTVHFEREWFTRWSARRNWLTVPSPGLLARLADLAPDVLHVHSLAFPIALRRAARVVPCPILVQDHADSPPGRGRRWLTAGALTRCGGVAFTARAQAEAWGAARCLPTHLTVFEVPESSSHFTPGDRDAARRAAGVSGEPAVAWVGRLHPIKDPLTALDAFAAAVPRLPDPHLWCCYTEAPLLERVAARVQGDLRLRDRVHLLGRLPHGNVETLLRACDLYVAASRREGSGFAVLEALACGVPAVVTDIPSFRQLTGDGGVAALTPPGDPTAMSEAIVAWWERPRGGEQIAVRAHFERHLSFAAVGAGLRAAYEQLRSGSCA